VADDSDLLYIRKPSHPVVPLPDQIPVVKEIQGILIDRKELEIFSVIRDGIGLAARSPP
jgi:hypothetical protein